MKNDIRRKRQRRGFWFDTRAGGPMPYPGPGVWLVVWLTVVAVMALEVVTAVTR
jgi:hypothetical protein